MKQEIRLLVQDDDSRHLSFSLLSNVSLITPAPSLLGKVDSILLTHFLRSLSSTIFSLFPPFTAVSAQITFLFQSLEHGGT